MFLLSINGHQFLILISSSAIINVVNTWGHQWAILFHSNNKAVVDIYHKGSMHDPETMALVCLLYFRAAHYDINVVIADICGADKCIADSLSHIQLHCIQTLAPRAQPSPNPIHVWPTPSMYGQPQPFYITQPIHLSRSSPINSLNVHYWS